MIISTRRERGFGRENSGVRTPVEAFIFEMEIQLPAPTVNVDWESELHEVADQFIEITSGGTSTESDILATKGEFHWAGVCHEFDVTSIDPVPGGETYTAMRITFETETRLYQ